MPNENSKILVPDMTVDSMFNIFSKHPYAPLWVRNLVGGGPEKQIWAGKMTQAVNLAALLFTLGYGSRKMMRGMSPEMQDALGAIDKYVPAGGNAAGVPGNERLVNKKPSWSERRKAKKEMEAQAAVAPEEGVKTAADVNGLAYLVPPSAALLAWLVGQKMAENEVQATDLSDSKARLAKARYDYNRVLASKLDPTVNLPEKVIKKRMQNPMDWVIDKSIDAKNAVVDRIKARREAKKAEAEANAQAAQEEIVGANEVKTAGEVDASKANFTGVYPDNKIPVKSVYTTPYSALNRLLNSTGIDKIMMILAALSMAGTAKYAWNNSRAHDKNIQKALDTEAALKQNALELNDQRLDIDSLIGKGEAPKLNTYPGAIDFQ